MIHFLVLGTLIFVAYGLSNRSGEASSGRIVVTQGKIDNLRDSFGRVWQRLPTPAELDGLIQDYIREEVLAREAMALGLDRDDTVIRRRLRQKMEVVANDLAEQPVPGETELEEFLAKHPDAFHIEPRFTLWQVYLSADRRGDALHEDVARLLAELNRAGAGADFQGSSDATLLPPALTDVPSSEVTRHFGEEFTQQLARLPEGGWHGPVTSSYGVHLVWVVERKPARMPPLAEVREQVSREWTDARRKNANEQLYQELRKRYAVTIDRSSVQTDGLAVQL